MNTDELAQITIPNSIGIAKLDTALAASDRHRQHGKKRRSGRIEAAGQCLVDAESISSRSFIVSVKAKVFPHPVIDDDFVVDRIPDQRQQGGDRGQVKIKTGQREEADGLRHVQHQCRDRTDRELPLEAEPDVNEHCQAGQADSQEAGAIQLAADFRSDNLDALETRVRRRRVIACFDLVDGGHLRLLGAGLALDSARGHGPVGAKFLETDLTQIEGFETAAQARRDQQGQRFDLDDDAADKIDAVIEARPDEEPERGKRQHDRNGNSRRTAPS